MKAVIKLVILLIIAVAIAVFIQKADGYVQVAAWGWLGTMTLLAAVIYVTLAFIVLYVLIRLFKNIRRFPQTCREWFGKRRMKKELSLFEKGWVMWLEGKDNLAEKDLKRLKKKTNNEPREIVAALAGAKFAHRAEHKDEADELIEGAIKASEEYPQLNDAALTVKADVLIDRGEADKALPLLNKLDAVNPNQINILKLKLRAYQQVGKLREVVKVSRYLIKKKELDKKAGIRLIEESAATVVADKDDELWFSFYESLTSEEQALPLVAIAAADRFDDKGEHKRVSKILESAIKTNMSPVLVHRYATECPESELSHRLAKTQKWLNVEPENTDLLNAAAYLCMLSQLWGQAQRYLSKSLSLQDKTSTHALLGALYDQMGRKQEAAEHWRKSSGMKLAMGLAASASVAAADDVEMDVESPNIHTPKEHGAAAKTQKESGLSRVFKPKGKDTGDDDQYFDSAPIPGIDVKDQ